MELSIGGYDLWPYVEFLALGLTLLLVWLFATNIVLAFKSIYSKKQYGKKFLIASSASFTILFIFNITASIIMATVIESTIIGLYSITVFSTWASMTIMSVIVTVLALRKEKEKARIEKEGQQSKTSSMTAEKAENETAETGDETELSPKTTAV